MNGIITSFQCNVDYKVDCRHGSSRLSFKASYRQYTANSSRLLGRLCFVLDSKIGFDYPESTGLFAISLLEV